MKFTVLLLLFFTNGYRTLQQMNINNSYSQLNKRQTDSDNLQQKPDLAAKLITGLLMMLAGLVFLFFGKKIVRVIVFLAGFFGLGFLVLQLSLLFSENPDKEKQKVIFITALCFGLVGGLLAAFIWPFGLMLLGGLFGFSLGTFFLASGVVQDPVWTTVILILFCFGGAIAIAFLKNLLLAAFTSFTGAVLIVSGVDSFIGLGYLNSLNSVMNGVHTEHSKWQWLLMAITLVLFGLGFFFQRKFRA